MSDSRVRLGYPLLSVAVGKISQLYLTFVYDVVVEFYCVLRCFVMGSDYYICVVFVTGVSPCLR